MIELPCTFAYVFFVIEPPRIVIAGLDPAIHSTSAVKLHGCAAKSALPPMAAELSQRS